MKIKFVLATVCLVGAVSVGGYFGLTKLNLNTDRQVGEVIDSLNGVAVYFNGGVNHVSERNVSEDGYNIGLKYQCVEFIKRYYFEHLNHRMPDSYGHAKDFFNPTLASGTLNTQRNLIQYRNGQGQRPQVNDILVYDASWLNPYGHVAIVSDVSVEAGTIEIIQQNPGPFSTSRETYHLEHKDAQWRIQHDNILSWLHKAG
ncbi:CHAP domain-containing protein [Photobacterium sp. GJ3]|uniref:CHAP domain-containing protein n=1 Tax=Photobacterium sp. GJ3 TaxID=2829502 RepID=UPI001B8C96D1|nr:CHAP domain-containing protein [Photobacterium sp. GJ3]QUJ66292.1 CHAP domain-containing protein [Photobacterium sp. GJ3]